MIDAENISKHVKSLIGADVSIVEKLDFVDPHCSLTVWLASRIRRSPNNPADSRVFLIVGDHISRVGCTKKGFESVLIKTNPYLGNVEFITSVFRLLMSRPIVESAESFGWLDRYEAIWHPPKLVSSDFVFFASDLAEGNFEKITIAPNYGLSIEVLGPGKRVARR